LKDRLCLIQRYGSFPLAYATLQSTLSHFDDDDGYIAYQPSSTGPLVLSEPVVDPSKRNRLIDSFLEKYPTATFFHLGSDLMTYLERLGHKTHRMGYEHILELDTFEGSWSSHRSLRSGFNKGIKQVSVSETTLSNLNPADLGRVLKDWLATKAQRRQNGFLCRPFGYQDEPGCRYFAAWHVETLVGILRFTPLYRQGIILSYYADFSAVSPQFSGVKDALYMHAIRTFKDVGIKQVHLGLAPFSNSDWYKGGSNLLFHAIHTLNVPRYGYQGITSYLNKFHATKHPIYMMSKTRLPITPLFRAWRQITSAALADVTSSN